MRLKALFAADDVVRDTETGLASAHNILNELRAFRFPIVVYRVAFLALLEMGDQDRALETFGLDFTVRLDDEVLSRVNLEMKPNGKSKAQAVLKLMGLPIPHSGFLRVEVAHDNNVLGTAELEIAKHLDSSDEREGA